MIQDVYYDIVFSEETFSKTVLHKKKEKKEE